MTKNQPTIAVLGAGAWGTMLAVLLAERGLPVRLWARREAHAQALQVARANPDYLPGVHFPESLSVSATLADVCIGSAACFMVVPSKALRSVMAQLGDLELTAHTPFISCAKGLEYGSFKRLSQVIAEYRPEAALAALSGPNLAAEIAAGLPASATVASEDEDLAGAIQTWLNQARFRVYSSRDIIGVEVCGALKNVIALAAGMSDGLGLGDNAKASLITRGLAEMQRLGQHLGGQAQTFYGLAGLGDMVATCSSRSSRNHRAGEQWVQGTSLEQLETMQLTAEGIPTVRAVMRYAEEHSLDLPISQEVYQVLFAGKTPQQALHDLMRRDAKAE